MKRILNDEESHKAGEAASINIDDITMDNDEITMNREDITLENGKDEE